MDCKTYNAQFPNCTKEQSSVSHYSPGRVLDEECLVRMVFSPLHIDRETGKLTQLAFQDATTRGLSVNRTQYTSLHELKQKASVMVEHAQHRGKTRQLVGFAKAKCEKIRSLKTSLGDKAFCVYDTATSQDISHVDVCQTVVEKWQGNQLREELRTLFSNCYFTLEENAVEEC